MNLHTNGFRVYFSIIYSLFLFLSVANIRYFSFFGWHINYDALNYLKFFDTTAGMLFEDFKNYPYIIVAVLICVLFVKFIKKLRDKADNINELDTVKTKVLINSIFTIFAVGLCFIGIRGSFQRYVLKVSFASFSDIPFYNKIGNNAIFNIIETFKQTKKNVDAQIISNVNLDDAIAYARQELQISEIMQNPLDRHIPKKDSIITPNVVLVLMESMTLRNLDLKVDDRYLTPFLRQLRDSAYYVENFYSAAIHTNNGICASMYGYTPNFMKPSMDQPSDLYTGLPYELRSCLNFN